MVTVRLGQYALTGASCSSKKPPQLNVSLVSTNRYINFLGPSFRKSELAFADSIVTVRPNQYAPTCASCFSKKPPQLIVSLVFTIRQNIFSGLSFGKCELASAVDDAAMALARSFVINKMRICSTQE